MALNQLIALGALLLLPSRSFQQQCSTASDVGQAECVLLTPYYTQYQWATCLTENYIVRASNYRHVCRSNTAIRCYYQCMIEVYGFEEGAVYGDCSCSPGEVLPTPIILPPECYSPSGDDCSWYRSCLEARYPCQGTDDGYAIEYAEKFCNLYVENYNDFSEDARDWIDGVRQCLQVSLVRYLRLWTMGKTCADIRSAAFESHPQCYLNPAPGVPGICQLDCIDAIKIFVLVNIEGRALFTAFVETVSQMWRVIVNCLNPLQLQGCTRSVVTTLVLRVPQIRLPLSVAGQIGRYISTFLNWDSNGFRWFPFDDDDDDDGDLDNRGKRQITTDDTENPDTMEIKIILVDVKGLNISNGTMSQPLSGPTLEQAVETFTEAVSNGMLSRIPILVNDTETSIRVLSAGLCEDTICNLTNVTELAIAPETTGSAKQLHLHVITFFCIIFAIFTLM